ncbi:MAG: PKD-like family lipoprotein [Rikenellaceae bacterium]
MKKILLLVVLAASMFMTSCYDDKGNYDYTPVEEVDLQTIVDEVVFTTAQMNIDYFIEVPIPSDIEELYDFHWEYVPDDADAELIGKVCDGADLSFVPRLMGDIEMYFVATHKEMKTEYYVSQTITVAAACSKGWLLLGVSGGQTTLSFAEPASAASSSVAKTWTTYNNFVTGLNSDYNSLVMQYGEYTASATSNTSSDDVALWISSPSEASAYSNESYELRSTLADNRSGVVGDDNIANWKDMLPMTSCTFLLEESGNLYMKYGNTMYGYYSDKPLEYNDVPFETEMMLYADYKFMPYSKYSGLNYLTVIGKDGSLKLVSTAATSYSTAATAGTMYDFAGATDINGTTLDEIPNISGYEALGGICYLTEEAEGNWYDAHTINIILKDGSDYSMASFIGYGYNMKMTQFQIIPLNNSGGYLTGDKMKFVTATSNDGAYSYFASGSDLCIINTLGEIIKIYTADGEIAAIDMNPQRTEVGMALTNGELVILNVEAIASPTIVHQMQYDVDSFVDMEYKYINLDDAWDAISD